jgi:hypothetical protein
MVGGGKCRLMKGFAHLLASLENTPAFEHLKAEIIAKVADALANAALDAAAGKIGKILRGS